MLENSSEWQDIRVSKEEFAKEYEKLNYCLEIGRISYDQEKERQSSVDKRAESLIKYSTLLIAVTNLVVSLMAKDLINIEDVQNVRFWYMLLMLVIIGCLILSLISQKPRKANAFPDGVWIFEDMQRNVDEYANKQERAYDLLLRYTSTTRQLQQTNDRAIIFLRIAYFLYVISVMLLMILLALTIKI